MDFALNLPLNHLSFGQSSVGILREIYSRGLKPAIFPIGDVQLDAYNIAQPFGDWLNHCLTKAPATYKRSTPVIKLWHIANSIESFGVKQILYTFYELDAPTNYEINTVRNNARVVFSSSYAQKIFELAGCNNVESAPLGFDTETFSVKKKQFFDDGRVTFNLCGKLEKRKHHIKVLRAWIKKYGDNPRYSLQCALFNPHVKPEEQKQVIINAVEGKRYVNVEFYPFMSLNSEYNDFLNSGNIILGMSGGEGFGLPEMQSLALGKHGVILNAHGYKEFATQENSVLVEPSGKIEAYDNYFFVKNHPYNQGSIFDFDEDEFIAACENAVERVKANPVNRAGLALQQKFTYKKLVDRLLAIVEEI